MNAAADVRQRMRAGLTAAIKARDRVSIAALRSAIAALDNAEAIDVIDPIDDPLRNETPVAGATAGLGATEAHRRTLTAEDIHRIVAAEVADREAAADDYERAGRNERAAELRAEAAVVAAYV